jgi:hypothetical protein
MTWRSPKLLAAAKSMTCVRCGADDGTIVGAHYTGMRRLALGGGFGLKVADNVHADLCHQCHLQMDQLGREKARAVDHSEEFLYLCHLTMIRRLERQVLK